MPQDNPLPPKLLLGELLVKEGLISREQLQTALAVQQRYEGYRPLGQVLVSCHFLSPQRLNELTDLQLAEILLSRQAITQAHLEDTLEYKKTHATTFGQALLARRHVTEQTLKQAIAAQLHIQFYYLDDIPIDSSLARVITFNYALQYKVCPIRKVKTQLTVVMDDPLDLRVVDEIAAFSDLHVAVATATCGDIVEAVERLYGTKAPGNTSLSILNFGEDASSNSPAELIVDEAFQFPNKGTSS